jgi:hypothetical protein
MHRHLIYILLIILAAACKPSKIVKTEEVLYPMKNDTLGIDSTIYKMLQPYKAKVDASMDNVLINSAIEFPAPDRKNIATDIPTFQSGSIKAQRARAATCILGRLKNFSTGYFFSVPAGPARIVE